MNTVFVLDLQGRSLLPTNPARARKLLRNGRAKVHQVVPFTIQLGKEVENPVGDFIVGVDDGAKYVGIAVVNSMTKEVVFKGTIKLRQDVHRKMLQRSQYRRTRRSRKLRCREARFSNRTRKGRLPPTITQKKDSVIRVLNDLSRVINITQCVVEQGQFDIQAMARGYKLFGKEYQKSEYEGNTWRQKVLWRDKYVCQHCPSKDNLQAHHITYKSNGGTNTVSNGITLCKDCHDALHAGVWVLNKKPKHFKYPAHLQQGKWYLFNRLKQMFTSVSVCFGWMTAKWRRNLKLTKEHFNDALAMVCRNSAGCITDKDYLIQPKRKKIWEDNPTKTCTEKNGFKHWDLVKANHRTKGIVMGTVRSLRKTGIALRTIFDTNFQVSYKKSKIIWRFNQIIYV